MIRLALRMSFIMMLTNFACAEVKGVKGSCLKIKNLLDNQQSVSELYLSFESIINDSAALSKVGVPSGDVPISKIKRITNLDFHALELLGFSTISFDGNKLINYKDYQPSDIDFVSLNGDARTTVIFTFNDDVQFNGEVFNEFQPYSYHDENKIYFVCRGRNITEYIR